MKSSIAAFVLMYIGSWSQSCSKWDLTCNWRWLGCDSSGSCDCRAAEVCVSPCIDLVDQNNARSETRKQAHDSMTVNHWQKNQVNSIPPILLPWWGKKLANLLLYGLSVSKKKKNEENNEKRKNDSTAHLLMWNESYKFQKRHVAHAPELQPEKF